MDPTGFESAPYNVTGCRAASYTTGPRLGMIRRLSRSAVWYVTNARDNRRVKLPRIHQMCKTRDAVRKATGSQSETYGKPGRGVVRKHLDIETTEAAPVSCLTLASNAVTLVVCLGGMFLVGSSAATPAIDVVQTSGNSSSQTAPSEPPVQSPETQSEHHVETKEEPARQSVTARAWKILTDAAADNDVSKRTEAISPLAIAGSKPRAFLLVESALQDKDPAVRRVAVIALGEMKSRKSLPKLRQMLEDDAPEVSFAAAQVLWRMGDRSGRQVLFEVLAGERNPSGGGLGRKAGEMKKKLHSPSAVAEFGAKQGARALLGPFAIGLTVAEELRKDNSASARALSAALLAMDRSPESAERLEQALDDKNWLVRATAAKSLANRRHRHALPRLEALLSDHKDVVRYSAAAAILALSV